MKLDVKGLALAAGILWGACMLVLTLANLTWPTYGVAFLQAMASVYPGYTGERSLVQVVVGTCYALVDGGIAGGVLAWLYNRLARR
ncbi:MAG: hypothetical protein A3E31_11160 [Candidatus Rokubacteria bacterium RIFCSPHIGHO2_12_FULL_73_22]|nr:MAG: hypothetical protein A3E31_11160 [Candidatus Rokubacteria bacterium RIFCSPHIGHO2_12_FULL_73_22]OGL01162.1 MAG: hypothetical protein A3D33_04015 [Candidatus Rokubacteria bacterium RIFCSPHIGHO2_02_FULL_73_26]OGL11744.1 MAG: hypothetical protein A3I14_00655 [Candidatus Rokubacteria bacterium RIFCSPLOWO2_02_FULL_73_56]OGL25569.1 MAG: hypothetical protein A3G44_09970 [Candidatus Rokubacteria bacterium RIFCSPLOWO2_12_FULL_73_47]